MCRIYFPVDPPQPWRHRGWRTLARWMSRAITSKSVVSRDLLAEHRFAFRRLELGKLAGEVLGKGRDAGITVDQGWGGLPSVLRGGVLGTGSA